MVVALGGTPFLADQPAVLLRLVRIDHLRNIRAVLLHEHVLAVPDRLDHRAVELVQPGEQPVSRIGQGVGADASPRKLAAIPLDPVLDCTEGYDEFVASLAAPIATAWNDSYRAGFSSAEDSRLFTAHYFSEGTSSFREGQHSR